MRKLFSTILVICSLLSGNAYAEIINLDCKSLIKDEIQTNDYETIRIDTKKKEIDAGFGFGEGYGSKIIEEDDKYFKALYLGSKTTTLYIDRYTGIVKVISISNVNDKKKYSLIEHYKCEKVEKKF